MLETSVQSKCRQVLVQRIQGLGLEGFEAVEIVARDRPSDWGLTPRGISIVAMNELEGAGTNAKDDYGYPFLVVISCGTGKTWDENFERLSRIRTSIRKAFSNKRPDVQEVHICGVRNDDFLADRPWQNNRALSVLVVTFWARESRD